MSDRPLVVQSDRTLLLDMHSEDADRCRDDIVAFCELVKSPEHLHTYSISALALWNACSQGLGSDEILSRLRKWSRFDIPEPVTFFIEDTCSRYGVVSFTPCDEKFFHITFTRDLYRRQILSIPQARNLVEDPTETSLRVGMAKRGDMKVVLINNGFPVQDLIPLNRGEAIDVSLSPNLVVRDYQKAAFDSFYAGGRAGCGYGVIVLPCGSGKTIVGLLAIASLKTRTLILAPNVASVHQWIRELTEKTSLTREDVGEYTSEAKELRKVTVCTYSMLVYRDRKDDQYKTFETMLGEKWGFVVYDEVHMLPAPVFRLSAALQSIYRMGLTATLVREDGREAEVFSLVGPKRYDSPWSELEKKGWIASASCHELRIPLDEDEEFEYAIAPPAKKIAIASKNRRKIEVVRKLLERHKGEQILIIGQYLDQLSEIQKTFGFPMITGSMPNRRRDELYQDFRDGKISCLVVSKVANFAIDLPDASVAIQISGAFGSRQEEAQRLGRILRPKERESSFYSLVSKNTREEEFSLNRQKFLVEQGYSYSVENYSG